MTDSVSNSFNGDNHGRFAQARDVGQLVFNAGPATTKALAALPATTTRFLGRDQELQQLRLAWSRPGLSVVASGLAGIGKTELVLHAAHAAVTAGEFPGGVLFIDLQGYDNARLVSASHALDNFLRALGVNGSDIPPEVDQRAQLFRSMLTEQERMLIVLDNASSADQVNPLLPGTPQHQVVISSRHRLSSLDNAQHLEIDSLGQAAAEELVGGSAELARLCGRLPLALRIIAALREDEPETDWVAELADARDRLELLDDGDSRAVHAAFDLSYSTLTPEQQRFFRLLAAHPGDEVEVDSATVLADLSLSQTRRLFRELRRAHLVEANGPGWYGLHDLVRLYARRRLHDGHQHEQVSALHRVLQHYTTKAEAADAVFKALASADYDQPEMLGTAATLMEWLERRRPILVAAVSAAATAGRDRTVCRLTKALNYLFDYGRHHLEWFTVFELGLSSARKLGDEPYEGFFLRVRGYVLGRLMRYDEAIQESRQGLEISRALNDHFHSAWTLRDIAKNLTRLGRYEEAREFAQEAL
ncbi:tetratricopeptide repeat protein, partial [Streptomyces anulatus]|uniref:tetratricopeptide repeat protein n=1 Tax=Streptomyces anulatus TaxID=1892 RepID=UPI0033C3DBFE